MGKTATVTRTFALLTSLDRAQWKDESERPGPSSWIDGVGNLPFRQYFARKMNRHFPDVISWERLDYKPIVDPAEPAPLTKMFTPELFLARFNILKNDGSECLGLLDFSGEFDSQSNEGVFWKYMLFPEWIDYPTTLHYGVVRWEFGYFEGIKGKIKKRPVWEMILYPQ